VGSYLARFREPGYALLVSRRLDEFGVAHCYCFAVFEDEFAAAQVEAIKIAAKYHRAEPVLVGQGIAEMPNLEWASFVSLFGGPILRVCANRRVAYVSRGSQKAVQSL
jgi:hypothetical protein